MIAREGIVLGLLAMSLTLDAAAQSDAAPPPKVEAGANGFALHAADGAWTLRLRGLTQLDARVFDAASAGDNEWLLRRVRPTLEGSFGERIDFRLMPDFGGGRTELVDAWVDVALGDGGPTLRAGKFKPPVGLERLRSANHLQLVERSVVTDLVPRRDIGVQLSGGDKRLTWAAGLFNGVIDGGAADENGDGHQEVAARIFAEPSAAESHRNPFNGLGVGIAATYGSTNGTGAAPLLPAYRSPGQKTAFSYRSGAEPTFADGERLRITPQLYWYRGPLGVLAEAIRVSQDVRRVGAGFDRTATLDHDAWQVMGNWFVTGEEAGFRDPAATGAIELVVRASSLQLDDASFAEGAQSFADIAAAASRVRTRAVGVNWYPMTGLKASLSYHRTSFTGGAQSGDRSDERVVLARLQLYF